MGCIFTIHIGEVPIIKCEDDPLFGKYCEIDVEKAEAQPYLPIGECSFLKAAMFGNEDLCIPKVIQKLCEIIPNGHQGKTRIIDEELIKQIEELEWTRGESPYKLFVSKEGLIKFLKLYMGKPCYYLCW